MKNESWLQAFNHELEAHGVGANDRAELVVETEGFLLEGRGSALGQFGAPADYARSLVAVYRPDAEGRPLGARLLKANGVTKSFGAAPVLDAVDLMAHGGEIVAVVGPNGSGKSTLLRILGRQLAADGGSVELTGSVGYAPQSGGLDDYLRPVEHFELFGVSHGLTRSQARDEGLRLADELGWDAAVAPVAGKLSGGTRRKLNVVTAIIGDPQILLLDEPCQGFDAKSGRHFWDLLWSWVGHERTAIVASHLPDVLSRATTVVELNLETTARVAS